MNQTKPTQIVNALTIDVEDYFQVNAFSKAVRQEDWDSFEPTVERNTYRILDLLDSVNIQDPVLPQAKRSSSEALLEPFAQDLERPHAAFNSHESSYEPSAMSCEQGCQNSPSARQRATFFILGWVAERYPKLVKEIHARGHEVACHGYAHQVIFNQTKKEFREDVKKAKSILEDLIGKEVVGYRAPTYSITKKTIWALEVLHGLGFLYDSSIFPINHDVYGFPKAPRFPCLVLFDKNKKPQFKELHFGSNEPHSSLVTRNLSASIRNHITEFPITTMRLFGCNLPVSGGGYFRLLPYPITRIFLMGINKRERMPFVFYVHPWELDPAIPKIDHVGMLSKFRTYVNLDRAEDRFRTLLSHFHFSPLSSLLRTYQSKGE